MNLSVLIHTFNGYSHLWDGCIKSLQRYWQPTMHQKIYWGTDIDSAECDKVPFQVLRSGTGEWSDRLARLLHLLPTEYIFYMQEDHWLISSPPSSYFNTGYHSNVHHDFDDLLTLMIANDLFRLQISPINQFYSLHGSEIPLFFHEKSKYLVSHQPSIWKKSFFLECLKSGENPWQNEYEGTKRLNNDPKIRGKIAIYPYDWYKHMCIKGQVVEP